MNKVETYITKKANWKPELELLRKTLLSTNLEETIKWGAPTYVYKNKNIVGIAAFKSYCGLWFFQGRLLKDSHKVLMNAQEGKTKAMLQWRFHSLEEIDENLIKEYALEAMQNVDEGKEIKPNRSKKELIIPEILQNALDTNEVFKLKFDTFSLSCKREYADYISEAKKETTKQNRLEKIIPMILNKVGLHDKYKNC
ncbi:YdeI/OmpD-associated family protein [Polaribacter uvawellassae]|uniref:YdeI/OmpD-associated family protein n=1 Tax=Polaribacter uvawellassae TaxID=3133495 RepID=UPI00321B2192